MELMRYPAVAGTFYPLERNELSNLVDNYLTAASIPKISNVKALIVPHAGYIYSGPIAGYGYKVLNNSFKKIIIIGLSHRIPFNGIAGSNSQTWQTPLGNISTLKSKFQLIDEAHTLEHSIEVQLPFLQTVLKDFKIIPLLSSRITDPKIWAKKIAKDLDVETLFIISSDLSHYNLYEEAQQIDTDTIQKILSLKGGLIQEEACGADGINILIEIAKMKNWKTKLLDYRNSGDTAGDKNAVVGYASIAFYK